MSNPSKWLIADYDVLIPNEDILIMFIWFYNIFITWCVLFGIFTMNI